MAVTTVVRPDRRIDLTADSGRGDHGKARSDGRSRRLALVAAITVGYLIVLLVRRPSALVDPTMWAEDGGVFISGSFDPWGHLLSPYAGQLWPLQRLIAEAVGAAPAPWWPWLLYLVSCVGAALAAGVVLSERAKPLLGSFHYRALAGLLLVLLPGTWEVQGNLANLHWWAMVAAMVLLAARPPRTPLGRVVELALIAVIAFTGLGGVLLVPVALWGAVRHRNRYVTIRAAIVGLAAALQVVLTLALSDRGSGADVVGATPAFIEFMMKRVGGGLVLGERIMGHLWVGGLLGLLVATLAAGLLLIVVGLIVTDGRGPSWAWMATGAGCILLATLTIPADQLDSALAPYMSGRYTLLALAAVVLVVVRALGSRLRFRRLAAAGALLLMVGGFLGDALLPTLAPGIPHEGLAQMQSCLDGGAPFADAPFCYVPTQPVEAKWMVLVMR